jgi:hypothetical protein
VIIVRISETYFFQSILSTKDTKHIMQKCPHKVTKPSFLHRKPRFFHCTKEQKLSSFFKGNNSQNTSLEALTEHTSQLMSSEYIFSLVTLRTTVTRTTLPALQFFSISSNDTEFFISRIKQNNTSQSRKETHTPSLQRFF